MYPQDIHKLDPFGGSGIPGDPMEQVLSLQTYGVEDEKVGAIGSTSQCDTSGCSSSTSGCSTSSCSGSTSSCNTVSCSGSTSGCNTSGCS